MLGLKLNSELGSWVGKVKDMLSKLLDTFLVILIYMNFNDILSSLEKNLMPNKWWGKQQAPVFNPNEIKSPVDMNLPLRQEVQPNSFTSLQQVLGRGGSPDFNKQIIDQYFGETESPQQEQQVVPQETEEPLTFEDMLEMMAQKSKDRGFHPATPVSQMAAESERGKSNFAKERNNYFGMGAYDSNPDNAFKYDSPEASMDAYLDLIEKDKRYKSAYEKRDIPEEYLQELLKVPYATDPNYFDMITNTPEFRKYRN
jgi:hypothetical protein